MTEFSWCSAVGQAYQFTGRHAAVSRASACSLFELQSIAARCCIDVERAFSVSGSAWRCGKQEALRQPRLIVGGCRRADKKVNGDDACADIAFEFSRRAAGTGSGGDDVPFPDRLPVRWRWLII